MPTHALAIATAILLSQLAAPALGRALFQDFLPQPAPAQPQPTQPQGQQQQGAPGQTPVHPTTCEGVYAQNPKARESGSCSLGGAVRPYVGPLEGWDSIRAMLAARSYKRTPDSAGELILTHESRTDMAAQWQWRMLRMGYAHTVIVVRGEHSCAPLRQLYGDLLGCVWWTRGATYPQRAGAAADPAAAPTVLPAGAVGLFLEDAMYWRLQLAAMVLRLGGHNIMVTDTDMILQDDFYWWMDTPEYTGYQMLSQYDGMGTVNDGFMYFRGAAPNGPAAWTLAEAVLRNVRWLEGPEALTRLNSSSRDCWDQASVTDTVYSALVGRPVFWRCLMFRGLDRSWATREDGLKAYQTAYDQLLQPALKRKQFPLDRSGPRCHLATLSNEGLWSMEGELAFPDARGEWPAALGGMPFEAALGPVAITFERMLAEAGTPMWPTAAAPSPASPPPRERFAYFSRHLVCDWSSCGQNGMYQPQMRPAGEEPCVVVGHFVVSPGDAMAKRFQLVVNGHHSAAVSEALHGRGGAFFATNVHHQGFGGHHHQAVRTSGLHHGRLGQQVPMPRVLALAPGALSPYPPPVGGTIPSQAPLFVTSKEHFRDLVVAMSSTAIAASRTLAIPRLNCDHPWMHRGPDFPFNGSHHVPWRHIAADAFAPFGASTERLSCEWYAWVQHGCLHGPVHVEGRGHLHTNPSPAARMLLSLEMEHYLELLPQADRNPVAPGSAAPGAVNLVTVPPGAVAGPDGVVNVTTAWLTAQLSRVAPEHQIVWLEKPMRVSDLAGTADAAHRQWMQNCCGLSWPQSFNHVCFWRF